MKKGLFRLIAISLSSFAICLLANTYFPIADITENWLTDLRVASLSPQQQQFEEIIVVTISENTLSELPYRTPVDREFLANIVHQLTKKKVSAIGIDLLFDQPTERAKDEKLFQLLNEMKIPLVVAYAEPQDSLTQSQIEFMNNSLATLEKGLAVVLKNTSDDVVRHVLVRRNYTQGQQLGFSAKIARQMGKQLPESDSMAIRFRRGPDQSTGFFKAFEAQSLHLLPDKWFTGKIVLIGADLTLEDRHVTPLSSVIGRASDMPGIYIHAYALAQLIDGTAFTDLGDLQSSLLILLSCILGAVLFASRLPIVIKVFSGVFILGMYGVGAFFAYSRIELILPLVVPSFGFIISAGTETIFSWRNEKQQKRFVKNAFSKFLAPSVINQLVRHPERLRLSGEKREMSFLFSDIAGFTGLTEKTEPEILVKLLNEYLALACGIVLKFGGTIDKIVGDALHVIFNAPIDQTDHAKRAVGCAIELDRVCEQFRRSKVLLGIDFGITRIGVNTGMAVVGNFGGEERFDYTAHGDAINIAARLESVNKHFGTRICVSETSAVQCPGMEFLPVGKLILKGKTEALKVYEPLVDGSIDVVAYKDAYNCLDSGEAKAKFEDLYKRFPRNPLVRFHYERLSSGESGTIIVMQSK